MDLPVYLTPNIMYHDGWAAYREIHQRGDGSHYVNIGGLRYSVELARRDTGWPHDYAYTTKEYPAAYWGARQQDVRSYAAIRNYFNNALVCPTWPENERPLSIARSRKFLVRKEADRSFSLVREGQTIISIHPGDELRIHWPVWINESRFVNDYTPAGVHVLHAYAGIVIVKTTPSNEPVWKARQNWKAVKIGSRPLRVKLKPDGSVDVLNKEEMVPFDVPALGNERTRALSKEYNFAAAKTWLKSVTLLTNDPSAERLRAEHERVDMDKALNLLREGKIDEAIQYVPLVDPEQVYGISRYRATVKITPGSIECLRRYLYSREGAAETKQVHLATLSEVKRARHNPYNAA